VARLDPKTADGAAEPGLATRAAVADWLGVEANAFDVVSG